LFHGSFYKIMSKDHAKRQLFFNKLCKKINKSRNNIKWCL
jgi:hypothetical protein